MNKMLVFNHRDYMNFNDVKEYIFALKDNLRKEDKDKIIVCPSHTYIPYYLGRYNFLLGAQDLSIYDITGEITAKDLKSLKVAYVILGHSQRRTFLKENNYLINKKIKRAVENKIKVILCIGETKEEHLLKKTQNVLLKQIKETLFDIKVNNDIIIAYEPVWTIGTNITPIDSELIEIVNLIKNTFLKNYNINIKVLYGGGVDDKSINRLKRINEIDGFVIGSASTNIDKTLRIISKLE